MSGSPIAPKRGHWLHCRMAPLAPPAAHGWRVSGYSIHPARHNMPCARWPMLLSASPDRLFLFQAILRLAHVLAFFRGREPPEKGEEQRRLEDTPKSDSTYHAQSLLPAPVPHLMRDSISGQRSILHAEVLFAGRGFTGD